MSVKKNMKIIPEFDSDANLPAEIPILLNEDELAAYLQRVHDAHTTLAHVHSMQQRVDAQRQNFKAN